MREPWGPLLGSGLVMHMPAIIQLGSMITSRRGFPLMLDDGIKGTDSGNSDPGSCDKSRAM